MAVTAERARTLALSLQGATSYPHFDRIAFRIPQRTFATLALDGSDLNLLFDPGQQAHFRELAPLAIAPVAGGWGRMGWTRCDLKQIDAATFKLALEAAHARASAPRGRKGGAAGSAGGTANASLREPGQPKAGRSAPKEKAPAKKRPAQQKPSKKAPTKGRVAAGRAKKSK